MMLGTVLATVNVVAGQRRCRWPRRAPRCARSRATRETIVPAAITRAVAQPARRRRLRSPAAPARRRRQGHVTGSPRTRDVAGRPLRRPVSGRPPRSRWRLRRRAARQSPQHPEARGQEQHGGGDGGDVQRDRAVLRDRDPQRHRLTVGGTAGGVQLRVDHDRAAGDGGRGHLRPAAFWPRADPDRPRCLDAAAGGSAAPAEARPRPPGSGRWRS